MIYYLTKPEIEKSRQAAVKFWDWCTIHAINKPTTPSLAPAARGMHSRAVMNTFPDILLHTRYVTQIPTG